jgi:hypothetical protein
VTRGEELGHAKDREPEVVCLELLVGAVIFRVTTLVIATLVVGVDLAEEPTSTAAPTFLGVGVGPSAGAATFVVVLLELAHVCLSL